MLKRMVTGMLGALGFVTEERAREIARSEVAAQRLTPDQARAALLHATNRALRALGVPAP